LPGGGVEVVEEFLLAQAGVVLEPGGVPLLIEGPLEAEALRAAAVAPRHAGRSLHAGQAVASEEFGGLLAGVADHSGNAVDDGVDQAAGAGEGPFQDLLAIAGMAIRRRRDLTRPVDAVAGAVEGAGRRRDRRGELHLSLLEDVEPRPFAALGA